MDRVRIQQVLETYDLATEPLLAAAREFVEQVWTSKPLPK